MALAGRPTSSTASSVTPQILFDIKCSIICQNYFVCASGAGTMMISKTVAALCANACSTLKAPILFAGELSGHFIFNDQRFIVYDDAMYAALRLLHWLIAAATIITIVIAMIIIVAKNLSPIWRNVYQPWSIPLTIICPCPQFLKMTAHSSSSWANCVNVYANWRQRRQRKTTGDYLRILVRHHCVVVQ